MRNALLSVVVVMSALSLAGCKKQVPNDIVQKSLKGALTFHAPNVSSGMCGAQTKGITNPTISVTKRNPDNTGVAHIVGRPWMGATGLPDKCEGDIEYKYSYTSKTTGYKRKTTTTTWSLEYIKLVGVQTKGVTFKPVNESAPDDDDTPQ
jgi:hypothetical protein